MCGIFGYVGNKTTASQITLDGLKLLEYRGYDSWGVASKTIDKKFRVEKHIGKIGDAKLKSNLKSPLAIGHTRWATHGGVTETNSHPHLDCTGSVAVVHNGIVENFEDLRKDLIKKGHKFISETDTEVIPHLIEEFLKSYGFSTSVRETFNKLKGLSAIVVANAKSAEIIAAKNGSPLVIGINNNGSFVVASDATGIVEHTKKVIFLEDNQMVILGKEVKLLSLPNGKSIKPKISDLKWKFEKSDKGIYKHFFIKEIHEEARIIESTALNSLASSEKLAGLINKAFGTFLIACGSASHAAIAATYLFSKIAKKHVNFSVGSEFKYMEDFITSKTLVIPISQSGESIDVIEPVTRAKEKGAKIAAITNVLGSTLYRISDFKLLLESGP